MKKFLQSLIERKRKELKDKEERMKNSQDIDEVRSLGETLIALRDEINDEEEQLKKLEEDNGNDDGKDTVYGKGNGSFCSCRGDCIHVAVGFGSCEIGKTGTVYFAVLR